ncbi:MAG: dolichyl-diphosphooligosaccharide--protein glycosyltransferase subunit STT3 [Methanobrevibacter sp.]|jgi:dolichyl-diphosphooligosaccharide--protein glycosyltransferase|nr:dolichyl-diphosphooligosaccharide--protein glycosyltransferase subunit STT3 [Candidatus Methanoflexus mossambicus]
MNNRNKTILISVAIIIFLIAFSFFIRAQAADLNAIPVESRSIYIDSDGLPYFSEMDSYYNLRLTEDFIDHGYFGDALIGEGNWNDYIHNQTPLKSDAPIEDTPWDFHKMAPYGEGAGYTPAIAYVTSFLYSIAHYFFNDISVKEVAFWSTSIISSLVAIPAFILIRRVTNNYGAVAGTLLLLFAPNYLTHSYAGFFDTDMFNVVLPLTIFLFFIEGMRNNRLILRIIFTLLSVLAIGLFSMSWNGYMFYPAVLIAGIVIFFALGFILKVDLIKPIKDYPNILNWLINQREIFSVLIFLVFGFITLYITTGSVDSIIGAITNLIGSTQTQASVNAVDIYPNVAISIGELQTVGLLSGGFFDAFTSNNNALINGVGGIVAFFGGLFILLLFIYRSLSSRIVTNTNKKLPKSQRKANNRARRDGFKLSSLFNYVDNINYDDDSKRTKRESLLYASIFGVWMIIALVAVSQGSRFLQIFMIPMGVFTGLFVGFAANYIKANLMDNRWLMVIAVACGFLIYIPMTVVDSLVALVSLIVVIVFGVLLIYGNTIREYLINLNLFSSNNEDSKNHNKSKSFISKFKFSKYKNVYVALIIFLAVVTPTVANAYFTTGHVGPGTSDPMWNAMTYVKEHSDNDTIMTSWWDFGYLFEIAADRGAFSDGGSQTGDRANWLGKSIWTNDSALSANLQTMISTSGNDGYNMMDSYTNDTALSVEIMDKILPMSKSDAITTMTTEYKFTQEQANTMANLTHPSNPRPVIFVLSSDMIDKSYWWSYFGSWDFNTKSSVGYSYYHNEEPVTMEYGTKIGPFFNNYINDLLNNNNESNYGEILITNSEQSGLDISTEVTKTKGEPNSTDAKVVVLDSQNKSPIHYNGTIYNPFTIKDKYIYEDGVLVKNETVNKTGEFSLMVIGIGDTYYSYIMNNELEHSMFTKMFVLAQYGIDGGIDQSRFEFMSVDKNTNGVLLWKIIPSSGTSTSNSTTTNSSII